MVAIPSSILIPQLFKHVQIFVSHCNFQAEDLLFCSVRCRGWTVISWLFSSHPDRDLQFFDKVSNNFKSLVSDSYQKRIKVLGISFAMFGKLDIFWLTSQAKNALTKLEVLCKSMNPWNISLFGESYYILDLVLLQLSLWESLDVQLVTRLWSRMSLCRRSSFGRWLVPFILLTWLLCLLRCITTHLLNLCLT